MTLADERQQMVLTYGVNLNPRGVAVFIEAEHLCMTMRGARAAGALTQTSALRGCMRTEAKTRNEVMLLLAK